MEATRAEPKRLILHLHMISMDKLRVYMLRAAKSFEGSTSEVCEQISKQIDSDLTILHDEKTAAALS
jgi:hypothetical protein